MKPMELSNEYTIPHWLSMPCLANVRDSNGTREMEIGWVGGGVNSGHTGVGLWICVNYLRCMTQIVLERSHLAEYTLSAV